ncbi:hypothetical protein JOB18_032582 [Solea senegalensis]|uniref:Uncharacterized protein n=1 Tax=Solea senegalensis TaxID=28829 RepID=A0AAV6PSX8_SOLSE|nr:hypothetical protein JOB18_032582 [Solea senegalensis]
MVRKLTAKLCRRQQRLDLFSICHIKCPHVASLFAAAVQEDFGSGPSMQQNISRFDTTDRVGCSLLKSRQELTLVTAMLSA